MTELSKEDALNGWTAETLAAYRRERDKVADVVPGNVVTEFRRPKPAMRIEGSRGYNPFSREHKTRTLG